MPKETPYQVLLGHHPLLKGDSWQYCTYSHFYVQRAGQGAGEYINAKSPRQDAGKSVWPGAAEQKLAATDSPTGEGSTIGAPGLNDSVRNGKR